MARPKLCTIAPHAPFLPTLVAAIRDGRLPRPATSGFGLADLTILVPTRRARLALGDALLDAYGSALLLPDIRALGDTDTAELPFLPPYDKGALPAPVSPAERRLELATLIDRWVRTEDRAAFNAAGFASPPSPGEILSLADSLGALIDACHTEGVEPQAFPALLDGSELSRHWENALAFLGIALSAWPAHLNEIGKADAARVRDLALDRLTEAVPCLFGDRPVIAAGSTGSVPATARLLAAIAHLPNGAVVLPGLDTTLSPETRNQLLDREKTPHGHPQYGLMRLLDRLGAGVGEVEELAPAPFERTRLVRHALALAEDTGRWSDNRLSGPDAETACAGLAVLAARGEDEEARAIALCARDAAETGRTVGIVTPDRNLARRIAAELRRYGISVDDAAGTPLHQSRAGRLMRSAIAAVSENWAPVPLVALLRNRHVTLGRPRPEIARLTDKLELAVLRGQRPAPGPDGLRKSIAANLAGHLDRPALRLSDAEAASLYALLAQVETALAPLARLCTVPGFAAAELASALGAVFAALTGAGTDQAVLPEGGDELMRFVEEIAALPGLGPRFGARHIAEAFEGLSIGMSVRAPPPETVGVSLLGLLEARLLSFDTVILAGLNEGVWPAAADPGPWLSRNMAVAIGLEPEERRQGQAAHDFEMALGNREIVLAYSTRIGTAPALPSRLLQRLETFLGENAARAPRQRGARLVAAARALDAVSLVVPAPRPMPSPPAKDRPRKLSVTEIEKLVRSPYDLYAKYVLNLSRLDPLGMDADLAERGTLIHEVLAATIGDPLFDPTAPEALDRLLAHADAVFVGLETLPARRAVWRRRLAIQGARVLAFEAERAPVLASRHVEIDGRWSFAVEGVDFVLRGRADRIDRRNDGLSEIIDFKTGSVPDKKEMRQLLAPQLLAEAKMLAEGGFEPRVPAGSVATLVYLKLPADPNGFERIEVATPEGMSLGDAVEALNMALQARIAAFLLRDDQPLVADILPKPNRSYQGDYEHLSRRAEWAAVEDAEEGS
ncbi:MAG: double-strand break repair protein AddB [Alphaproteobacteria bacterium]|nr:double-strand break repair protein AddB [Alphaproteobacteria bacterium]